MQPLSKHYRTYPIYAMAVMPDGYIAIAGGGGKMKSGVPNACEVLSLDDDTHELSILATGHLTDAALALTAHKGSLYNAIGPGLKSFRLADGALHPLTSFHHDVRIASSDEQTALSVTPDNAHLIAASDEGNVTVLRLPHFEPVFRGQLHQQGIADLSVAPDGLHAATSGRDKVAQIWRVADGKIVAIIHPAMPAALRTHVRAIRFTADPHLVFSAESNPRQGGWLSARRRVGPSAAFEPVASVKASADALTALTVDADGARVAASSAEGHVMLYAWNGSSFAKLWSSEPGGPVLREVRPPHNLPITGIEFSACTKYLLTSSADYSVFVWPGHRDTSWKGSAGLLWALSAVVAIAAVAILVVVSSRSKTASPASGPIVTPGAPTNESRRARRQRGRRSERAQDDLPANYSLLANATVAEGTPLPQLTASTGAASDVSSVGEADKAASGERDAKLTESSPSEARKSASIHVDEGAKGIRGYPAPRHSPPALRRSPPAESQAPTVTIESASVTYPTTSTTPRAKEADISVPIAAKQPVPQQRRKESSPDAREHSSTETQTIPYQTLAQGTTPPAAEGSADETPGRGAGLAAEKVGPDQAPQHEAISATAQASPYKSPKQEEAPAAAKASPYQTPGRPEPVIGTDRVAPDTTPEVSGTANAALREHTEQLTVGETPIGTVPSTVAGKPAEATGATKTLNVSAAHKPSATPMVTPYRSPSSSEAAGVQVPKGNFSGTPAPASTPGSYETQQVYVTEGAHPAQARNDMRREHAPAPRRETTNVRERRATDAPQRPAPSVSAQEIIATAIPKPGEGGMRREHAPTPEHDGTSTRDSDSVRQRSADERSAQKPHNSVHKADRPGRENTRSAHDSNAEGRVEVRVTPAAKFVEPEVAKKRLDASVVGIVAKATPNADDVCVSIGKALLDRTRLEGSCQGTCSCIGSIEMKDATRGKVEDNMDKGASTEKITKVKDDAEGSGDKPEVEAEAAMDHTDDMHDIDGSHSAGKEKSRTKAREIGEDDEELKRLKMVVNTARCPRHMFLRRKTPNPFMML